MEQLGSHAGFKKERKEIREIIEKIEAALSDGDITEARELKKEKNKLEKSLERKMKRNQKKQNEIPELTTEDAAEVVFFMDTDSSNTAYKGRYGTIKTFRERTSQTCDRAR